MPEADIFADPTRLGFGPASVPAPKDAPAPPDIFADPTMHGFGSPPGLGTPGAIDPITQRPYQSVGNIPAGDVVGQSTGKPIEEGRVPGLATSAIVSLPTDPQQKIRVVAAQLFPNLDPKDAQARIFFGDNGRMAAVGIDGKPFYVEPAPSGTDTGANTFSSASIASTLPTTDIGARIGSSAGPALPAAGGVAGGAIAGPTSMVGGPIGAATGAALGDVVRQTAAQYFDPQQAHQPYNYGQTAGEAAGAGAGQLVGASALRFFAPNTLSARLADPRQLRASLPQAGNVNTLAEGMDVHLTPGQLSGSPSLIAAEDAIHSGSVNPANAATAQRFYEGQRNDLMDAFDQHVLDRISSASDKTDAALQFQQGREDATRIVRQQANAAARPQYDAARAGGQVMSPDLAQLADAPAVKTAMDAARTDYANYFGKAAPDTPDFDLWNLTKQKLDDQYTAAQRAGDNTTRAAVDNLRQRLLTNLDAAYPTYEAGRALAAPGLRLASRMQGAAGSADAGSETAQAVVAPVFQQNNPRAIAEMRDAFTQAGRQDEWNAGTRAYLQNAIDNASKSQDGLNPSMLRAQIWGNPNTRAAMQAAMTPAQFQGLDNYMAVLEAAARSRGMNSLTAPRTAMAGELRGAADQGGAGAVRALGNVSDVTQGFGFKPLMNAIADRMQARNLQGMTDRLFSPDGMRFLQQMASVSPMSLKGVTASSEFLGQQAADAQVTRPRVPLLR
jgi:hypothetical protein